MHLVSFEKDQTKMVLNLLSIKTKPVKENEIILNEDFHQVRCDVCCEALTTKNLGNIAKGSKLLFCDNPACFATHLAKNNY